MNINRIKKCRLKFHVKQFQEISFKWFSSFRFFIKKLSCGYWKFCNEIRYVKILRLPEEKAKIIFNEMYLKHLEETKQKRKNEKQAAQQKLANDKKLKEKKVYEMLYLFYSRYI